MGLLDLIRPKSLEELEEEQKRLKEKKKELADRVDIMQENRKLKDEIRRSKHKLTGW